MAFDDDYLWVAGSHSRKRKKLNPEEGAEGSFAKIRPEANRYILGRIPLTAPDDRGCRSPVKQDASGRIAACLPFGPNGNALTKALEADKHLAPFLALPGKENGLDIEGLAAKGDRILLGLRGPVLRGWAVILELRIAAGQSEEQLELKAVGGDGKLYRKHFLQLDGFGIRELCWHGDDLLILAGPTMDHDGPISVFRWKQAAAASGPEIVERRALARSTLNRSEPACDKAEGLCLYSHGKRTSLLVVYDAPSGDRRKKRNRVEADLIPLPAE
jgi:hypothetical protein